MPKDPQGEPLTSEEMLEAFRRENREPEAGTGPSAPADQGIARAEATGTAVDVPGDPFGPPPGKEAYRADPFSGSPPPRPVRPDRPPTTPGGPIERPVSPGQHLWRHRGWIGAGIAALIVGFGLFARGGTPVEDVGVGDCFDDPGNVTVVETIDTVDCGKPHDYEAYALLDYPASQDSPYPGEIAMFEWADNRCYDRFEGFIGRPYEDSEIYFSHLTPTGDSWNQGDREVLCVAMASTNGFDVLKVEGTLRGSRR